MEIRAPEGGSQQSPWGGRRWGKGKWRRRAGHAREEGGEIEAAAVGTVGGGDGCEGGREWASFESSAPQARGFLRRGRCG